jgi:hypothetical protein
VVCLLCHSFLTYTEITIDNKGATQLAEALKSNSSLTLLILDRIGFVASFHSHSITGNKLGNEGVAKLSEALKSNSSLTSLELSGNRLFDSFDSHSIQEIVLVQKELPNYLKHSNQIHLSCHLISVNTLFASFHSHSIQTIMLVTDTGAAELSEALLFNTSLASLDLRGNKIASFHTHSI